MEHLLPALVLFPLLASALELAAARKRCWHTWFSFRAVLSRAALFLVVYALWLGILGRPWSALLFGLGTVGFLVAASRAKQKLLHEPLVFLDLQFLGHALRHPSLYYGHVLLRPRNLALVAGVVLAATLVAALLHFERPLHLAWFPGWRAALASIPLLLWMATRRPGIGARIWRTLAAPADCLDPAAATERWGLFVPMIAQHGRWVSEGCSRHSARTFAAPFLAEANHLHPHVIAVQCESFVDPARFFRHAPELPTFRAMQKTALAHGPLRVPAGGAYTMRTEFSFLTGLAPESLGCDRYNPYARTEKGNYPSLAKILRAAGYATEFVHPHELAFFRRQIVMPALGFERLHGARAFRGAERIGAHVSDAAVAKFIARRLVEAEGPRFIFAVTMENHGPWSPGRLDSCDSPRETYLRHLANSDRMLELLADCCAGLDRPSVLCWYGDHAPILDYDFPCLAPPLSDYLIAATHAPSPDFLCPEILAAHQLAPLLLSLLETETAIIPDNRHRLPALA